MENSRTGSARLQGTLHSIWLDVFFGDIATSSRPIETAACDETFSPACTQQYRSRAEIQDRNGIETGGQECSRPTEEDQNGAETKMLKWVRNQNVAAQKDRIHRA